MDLVTSFLNLVAPPTTVMLLLFILPPLYFFKLFRSVYSHLFPQEMTHKVVVITGASSGIGEQLAYQYAKRGASLVLVARREGSLRDVAQKAQDLGSPDVLVIAADVAKPEDCRRFVDSSMEHFGRLDHLVANAGISNLCLFEETTDVAHFRPIMDINFWGCAYPCHYALPHLKKTNGRIVANVSASAWNPLPKMSFYNASKAAMVSFFETLRIELGNEVGITIAMPGWTESEMSQGKYLTDEGKMEVDQEARDTQVGLFPVEFADVCAKAMVDAACRGDRYVTVPAWFRMMYLWRVFAPEVMDWCYRMIYVKRPGMSKRILEMSGAKSVLYPSSIQNPEIKKD